MLPGLSAASRYGVRGQRPPGQRRAAGDPLWLGAERPATTAAGADCQCEATQADRSRPAPPEAKAASAGANAPSAAALHKPRGTGTRCHQALAVRSDATRRSSAFRRQS